MFAAKSRNFATASLDMVAPCPKTAIRKSSSARRTMLVHA